jgi:hypothetical protein
LNITSQIGARVHGISTKLLVAFAGITGIGAILTQVGNSVGSWHPKGASPREQALLSLVSIGLLTLSKAGQEIATILKSRSLSTLTPAVGDLYTTVTEGMNQAGSLVAEMAAPVVAATAAPDAVVTPPIADTPAPATGQAAPVTGPVATAADTPAPPDTQAP